jgi:hypothetical protein
MTLHIVHPRPETPDGADRYHLRDEARHHLRRLIELGDPEAADALLVLNHGLDVAFDARRSNATGGDWWHHLLVFCSGAAAATVGSAMISL